MSVVLLDERKPLTGTVEIHGERITIKKIRGAGSSSICYDVYTEDSKHTRILKQFYPNPKQFGVRIEPNGTDLEIDGCEEIPELHELGDRFEEAYEIQNRLSNNRAMNAVVKTDWCDFSGATKFAMFEANWDTVTLCECGATDLLKKLQQCLQLTEALDRVHQEGILYVDIKPENVLWDAENKRVKLFDFDAAIDTKELDNIHGLRATSEAWIAPEIRCMQCFDQDKYLFLNSTAGQKTDIFSLGCMMFRYLFGEDPTVEEEKCCDISSRLQALNNDCASWRKLLSEAELKLFQKIMTQSIAYHRRNRYASCKDITKDLRELIHSMEFGKRDDYPVTRESMELLSAQLLDEHPLFHYTVANPSGKTVLDAVIVGGAPIRDALFKNIFACAQLPDTELNIRFVSGNAAEYLRQLLTECPLLNRTAEIYLDGLKQSGDLDVEIALVPLAKLWFYGSDSFADTAEEGPQLLDLHSVHPTPRYYLLTSEDYDVNLEAAKQIVGAAKREQQPVFVGYLDERGDGFDVRSLGLSDLPQGICFAPFANNVKYSASEEQFQAEIERRAFAVHSYYTKQYWERASRAELEKDFREGGKGYNYRSSMRSALSIPYKLYDCGIRYDEKNAGLQFYQKVLKGDQKTCQRRNRMMWLEHRSWLAFMITEGWVRPSQVELTEYAFKNGCDHRNKKNSPYPLHPCVCASDMQAPLLRDVLSLQQWDTISEAQIQQLDPLDQMSLRLHQFCNNEAKKLDLDILFAPLENTLRNKPDSQTLLEDTQYLHRLALRMKQGEPNVNFLWKRVLSDLKEKLRRQKEKNYGDAIRYLECIEDETAVVVERNRYCDYKEIDETLLEAIPYILLNPPIKRIYKVCAAVEWKNQLSTVLLEPDELIILSDTPVTPENMEQWSGFFTKRGLGHVKLRNCKLSEVKEVEAGSVLDITGGEARDVFRATSSAQFQGVPVVECRDGKLCSLFGMREIEFCSQKRMFTVEETLGLLDAAQPAPGRSKLPELRDDYKSIWSVYQESRTMEKASGSQQYSTFPWRVFSRFISGAEMTQYKKINLSESKDIKTVYTKPIETRLAKWYQIPDVLLSMQAEGLIESFTMPETSDRIEIKTRYPKLADEISSMYEIGEKEHCQFELRSLWNEPLGGRPLDRLTYYIYRDTKTVRATVQQKTETSDEDGGARKGAEKGKKNPNKYDNITVIKSMLNLLGKKDRLLISRCGDTEYVTPVGDGNYEVCFQFRNPAVKECFLKEGNALEVYTYQTIRDHSLFDDYRMNVEFAWDSDSEDDFYRFGAVTNEVDVICTRGIQTFFFSCKQCQINKDYLTELRYLADRFGVNARAILVCSHISTINLREDSPIVRRAKSMGISIIPANRINNRDFAKAIQAAAEREDFGGLI